jgi:hypothetical protein
MRLVEGPRLEIAERERLSPRVADLQVTLDTVAAEA